jgi:hypothetical protein
VWIVVAEETALKKGLHEKCEELAGCCVAQALAALSDRPEEAILSLKTLTLLSRVIPESLMSQLQLICSLLDPPA